jgi:hypothetical protein
MPIPVICACSAKLKVGDHLKGKHIKCPKCGILIAVGAANGAAAATAPAAAPRHAAQVPGSNALPVEERGLLERQLDAGERVVWADKPVPELAYLRAWIGAAGLFSVGLVLLVVLVIMVITGGWKFSSIDGLIMIVLVGLLLLATLGGGFLVPPLARWRTRKNLYAFTNRKAYAWRADFLGRLKLTVYEPAALTGCHRHQLVKTDEDIGNVVFGATRDTRKTKDGEQLTGSVTVHGFFYIRHVTATEKLLRETLVDPLLQKVYG